jgi:hypothetical protein
VIGTESLGPEVVSGNFFQTNCTQESSYNTSRIYNRFHHIQIITSIQYRRMCEKREMIDSFCEWLSE